MLDDPANQIRNMRVARKEVVVLAEKKMKAAIKMLEEQKLAKVCAFGWVQLMHVLCAHIPLALVLSLSM